MVSVRLRLLAAIPLALSTLFGLSISVAFAHAQYGGSTLAANASLQSAPSVVQIPYPQELSDIPLSITGPQGGEVTTAPAKFDLENRHNASVSMSDDGPG